MPISAKPRDVAVASAAADDLLKQLVRINQLEERIKGRRGELYTSDQQLKAWAHDEHNYLEGRLEQLNVVATEIQTMSNNVGHVLGLLTSRFSSSDARIAEIKRKALRNKEYQRKKRKRQDNSKLMSTYRVVCMSHGEDVSDSVIAQGKVNKDACNGAYLTATELRKWQFLAKLHLRGIKYLLALLE
jgi:hypothetical protein